MGQRHFLVRTFVLGAVGLCGCASGPASPSGNAPAPMKAAVAAAAAPAPAPAAAATTAPSTAPAPVMNVAKRIDPHITETRTVAVTQTVTLADIPAGAKKVRMWVPVPSDTAWQRVLDLRVVAAPGAWKIVPQTGGRGDFVYAEVANPPSPTVDVVVQFQVERKGVRFPIEQSPTGPDAVASADAHAAAPAVQPDMFKAALDERAPLMEVTPALRALADQTCGNERDPAKQAVLLMRAVASAADHYSKDPSKPNCGIGSAEHCISQGGGCCTDLHSLFIALARARGIPARMQYGYRLLDAKAGPKTFDPGYRCWVEYFIPGAGWVPTDVVASDNAGEANPVRWGSLSATRVWLWEGRSFALNPPLSGASPVAAAGIATSVLGDDKDRMPKGDWSNPDATKTGRVDTMLCGFAEIDGRPVEVLPSAAGKASQLTRTVNFTVLSKDADPAAAKLPE